MPASTSEVDWTIDAGEAVQEHTARERMERVGRLASERQDAGKTMLEPPAGGEAGEDTRRRR